VHASGGRGLQAFLDAGQQFADETVQISGVNLLVAKGFGPPRNVSADVMALALKTIDPRFTAYGGFGYWMNTMPFDEAGLRAQLEELMDSGFDGLKMNEGKPNRRFTDPERALDHPRYNGVGELLQETGWHVVNHVNDPEEFWDPDKIPAWANTHGGRAGQPSVGYLTDEYVSKEQIYQENERWLERYPNMNVSFAHAFFLSNFPNEMERYFEKFPNLSIDICPGVEMFDGFTKQRDRWIQFYIKYQDRILFGTDNAVRPFEQVVGHDGSYYDRIANMRRFLETNDRFEAWGYNLHGFALPECVTNKIYSENFLRMRGPVKPVVPAKALKYANRLYAEVKDRSDVDDISKQEIRETITFFEKRL
jgi:predicted TIM-barrel fold metal-dependent hydrolase